MKKILHYKKIANIKSSNLNVEASTPGDVEALISLIEKMIEVAVTFSGIGLAAPQIGVFKRFFIMKNEEKENSWETVINPSWTVPEGTKKSSLEEGCLSVPEMTRMVERNEIINASWYTIDEENKTFVKIENKVLTGMTARVFQHETDHLNGLSIVTKASAQGK